MKGRGGTARPDGSKQRRRHERTGRHAERIAALFLMLKGYRILARRVRTPAGEIDLIAVRGRRLAFVEVKYRDTMAAALDAVSLRQSARIASAAEHWAWQHPAYREHRFGFDALFIAPWCLPRHDADRLQPPG